MNFDECMERANDWFNTNPNAKDQIHKAWCDAQEKSKKISEDMKISPENLNKVIGI